MVSLIATRMRTNELGDEGESSPENFHATKPYSFKRDVLELGVFRVERLPSLEKLEVSLALGG